MFFFLCVLQFCTQKRDNETARLFVSPPPPTLVYGSSTLWKQWKGTDGRGRISDDNHIHDRPSVKHDDDRCHTNIRTRVWLWTQSRYTTGPSLCAAKSKRPLDRPKTIKSQLKFNLFPFFFFSNHEILNGSRMDRNIFILLYEKEKKRKKKKLMNSVEME